MLALGAVMLAFVQPIDSEEDLGIEVEVMIDSGNGMVEWTNVSLDVNRTAIKATELACSDLGISLVVSWSQWGAFVSEIGGVSPPDWSWWWGFFVWNHSQNIWVFSSVGANDLELNDKDIIGWSPCWDFFNPAKPIATPSMKYPWTGFQHDALNSGLTKNPGPAINAVSWIFDTQTMEMAGSPAIADGRIVVNNWGGTFCLNEEGGLLWKNAEVIGGFSPTIGHGNVLVGGKDGNLYSLNITNGEILWETQITTNPGLCGVTSASKIVRGNVYLGSYDYSGGSGYLYCLNEKDGQILWKNTTFSSVYFSSPAVLENKVYIGTMGLYDSSTLKWMTPYGLFCFDAINGELLWNYSVEGSVGSSPTLVDDRVIFTSKDGYLYCLNSTVGSLIWKRSIESSVSSPAVAQNKIFVGSGEMGGEGKFFCFDINGDPLWEFQPNGAVQSSPAVSGDYVYFASNVQNGTVYCLDTSSGQLVWNYKPWPEQFIISSPAIVEGKMLIASDNGRLYCFTGDSPEFLVDDLGSTQIVNVGEDVKFIFEEEENKLILTRINQTSVTLQIESMYQAVNVDVGETIKVDTDGDGKNDMSISVDNVNSSSQTVSLTLKYYSEEQNDTDDMNIISYLAVIIIVTVIITIGTVIIRKRKGKK